jgi:hypothetical protein
LYFIKGEQMSDISVNELAASGAPFRVGVALSKTFSIFSSRLGSFLLLAFVPLIPVLAVILMVLVEPQRVGPGTGALGGLSALLTFVLGIVAQATALYGAFQQMGGKPFSIGDSLSVGFRRALPVIGVALLSGLGISLAAILFVIPGIIVACMLYVAVPVCVIEKAGVFESLNRSGVLTRGYRWQIFGLLALVTIAAFIGGIVVGWLGGVVLWARLLSFGWQIVTTAFGAVLVAVVYHDLRVAKEGIDIDSLANVFD